MRRKGNFKKPFLPKQMFGVLEVYENIKKEQQADTSRCQFHDEVPFERYSEVLACEINHSNQPKAVCTFLTITMEDIIKISIKLGKQVGM